MLAGLTPASFLTHILQRKYFSLLNRIVDIDLTVTTLCQVFINFFVIDEKVAAKFHIILNFIIFIFLFFHFSLTCL